MAHANAKLQRLRGLFIAYFAVWIAINIWFGSRAVEWMEPRTGHPVLTPRALVTLGLLAAGFLFATGLWLFHHLLQKKCWARTVLLVIGWLVVIDGVTSLLFIVSAPGLSGWLERFLPGFDWQLLLRFDRVKDLVGLVFWGYLVFELQTDPEVKRAFGAGPENDDAPPPANTG